MLRTVDEVVRALGGTTKVAAMLDVGLAAVSAAKSRGHFPAPWHLRLYHEITHRKLNVAPELWVLPERKRNQ
jgi:hypothetical protein